MKRLALVLAVLAALVGCDKGGMTLQDETILVSISTPDGPGMYRSSTEMS